MEFVLDASIAVRWLLIVQQTEQSLFVLSMMPTAMVYVPSIWTTEGASVAVKELNKGTISLADINRFFFLLGTFDIRTANVHADIPAVFAAARRHSLAPADASCVELASTVRLPLASADDKMCEAGRRAGFTVLPEPA